MSSSEPQRLPVRFRQRLSEHQAASPPLLARPVWYRAAAVIGVLLAAGAGWLWFASAPRTVHTTAYGEIRTVTLPDSSVVTLNAHSSLRYVAHWDPQQPREVWLDGEAFFSVVHTNDDQRFYVHLTDDFRVEVLGTEFNVKDRRDEAQVVLRSGRVQLAIDGSEAPRSVTMRPGELVEFSEASQALVQKPVNPEYYVAWRHHRMVFEKTELRQVANALEDHYGVTISIPDTDLARTQLTGAFPTRNLDMILTALPTIVAMEVSRNENKIILRSPQTNAP